MVTFSLNFFRPTQHWTEREIYEGMKKYRLKNLIKEQHKRELKIPGNYCQPDLLWTSNYLISPQSHRIINYRAKNNKMSLQITKPHITYSLIKTSVCVCVCVSSPAATPQSWRPAGSCWFGGWAGWRWQTRLSLWKQPWQRHKDTCVNHTAKGTMATILGLIQETLWSGWNGECQASENTSQHESTGNGSRELFSNGGFDRSGPVIKRQPFTWRWQCVCVCVCEYVCVLACARTAIKRVAGCVCMWKRKRAEQEWEDRKGGKTGRKKSKNRE